MSKVLLAGNSNRLPMLAMMMASMNESISLSDVLVSTSKGKIKKVKLCKECGIEHTHHNDWCSGYCCIEYKEKKRLEKLYNFID